MNYLPATFQNLGKAKAWMEQVGEQVAQLYQSPTASAVCVL